MSKPKTRGRSRRFGAFAFTLLAVLLLLGVGVVLAVSGVHVPILSSVFAKDGPKDNSHPGKVAVLVSPTNLSAFTALDPAAFIDPKTSDFYVAYVSEKAAESAGFIRDPSAIRGRVLNHDKGPGLAFTESDFYPRGSQASQTSAIRPGHRGITLSAQDVEGLRGLKRFDRVDIVAVISKQSSATRDQNAYIAPEVITANEDSKAWETTRRIVAQNAQIVVPVPDKGARGAATPEEAFLVVTDAEFAAISEARTRGAKMQCAARSGLPGGDASDMQVQESVQGSTPIRVTEGTTSTTTHVPLPKEVSPAVDESNGSVPTPK